MALSANPDPPGPRRALQALHAFILYVPGAALLFSVTPLSARDWRAITAMSAPVILLDEVLKLASRVKVPLGPRRRVLGPHSAEPKPLSAP